MPSTKIETTANDPGKFSIDDLKSIVFGRLGAPARGMLVPPAIGHDFNVQRIDDVKVLLASTDPLYVNPVFGIEKGTWLGFQIVLSDMLLSGQLPQQAIFTLNLPNAMDIETFDRIWSVIDSECKRLGIVIISGHTGRYDGCDYPILGAGTMLATCGEGEYIGSSSIQQADDILLAGNPASEALASLLAVDSQGGEEAFGAEYPDAREAAWADLSIERVTALVVDAIRQAGENPFTEIHVMHDIAEKGVLGAASELCEACGFGCRLDFDSFPLDPEVKAFLELHFPDRTSIWSASGQGGVLVACNPARTETILNALLEKRIPAARIGRFSGDRQYRMYTVEEMTRSLMIPIADPFWPAFQKVLLDKQ
jgi:hydrogenase maturation factor